MSESENSPVSRRDLLLGSLGALAVPSCAVPAVIRGEPVLKPFDLDTFVADCVAAARDAEPQAAVQDVMRRAFHNPRAVLTAVGEPTEAGLRVLHRASNLTMFAATWTPRMNLMPHNHEMWALIGIYTGREDNILWRRTDPGVPRALTSTDAQALFEGDVAALPTDAIHSVTNPLRRFTGGIHVYGGDFFATERSQWDPETLAEQPSDGDVIRAIFKAENERLRAGR